MSSRSFAPAGATFFWQQRQKKAKTPTGEGGNPRKEDAAALSGKAAKGCAVRMPPLLHLSHPTKEGPAGPPLDSPVGLQTRPFGHRGTQCRGASGARRRPNGRAASAGKSKRGPQPTFGRCGGLGVPRGKGTHSKGSLSPLACFCLLFPRGKRRSARRPKLLLPSPPQVRNSVIKHQKRRPTHGAVSIIFPFSKFLSQ